MTRIGIVQLSDIHFHEGTLSNYMQAQMTAIATAVASLRASHGVTDVIVVLSGDLAYSGKQSEYEHAVNLLDSIRTKASENFAPVIHFLMVPGNHDCDFQKDTPLRKHTLSGMNSLPDEDLVDPSIANTCTGVQDEFWTFASLYHTLTSGVGNLYSSANIGLADSRHKVVAHLLNTAWVSKVREEQGVMRYPVQLLTNTNEEKNASVVLAIMHHPANWLMSSNGKALIKRLTATVDIVMTGHEHDADSFGRISHGGKLTFIEGGVINDSHDIENSNFNLLVIDPDEHKYDMYIYKWNSEDQAYLPRKELADYSYRNKSRKQGGYVIREDYKQSVLQELGIAITHPHKQTVLLRDIFVFPDFREFDLATNVASVETIFGDRIVGYITSKRKVLVTGSDQSGKTSLSKVLFEELIKKDFIPLIVNGREITDKTDGGVRDLIEKTYNEQYDSPSHAVFMQDSVKKRAIIVDDYHKIRHRGTLRNRIVKILCEIAETVVILGSHEAMLDEFSTPAAEDNILLRFSFCTILEFGNVRQSELVRRWYSLGRDAIGESSHAEREKQAALAERAIQTALSKDFVPADPITILGMLYQIESQTKIDVSCSSYGHLFDVLVKTNLGVAKYDSADFDSRFTYLSELAFYMYERRNFRLDRSSQQEWQEYYRSAYRPPFNCEHLVHDLVDAQVLSSRDGELSFRYKYHYYYFVGRYFADHITESESRQQVARMCRRLYNEDSANIILFMCHFSKDKFILKTIIDTAAGLFKNYPECQLEDDVSLLNAAISKALAPRDLRLTSDNNPAGNRKRLFEEQDLSDDARVAPKSGDQICVSDPIDDERDQLFEDEVLQTNATFKTIQILGQALRSFYGSMRSEERLEIARECFSLGLRLLSFYARLVVDHRTELHDGLVSLLRAKREHMQPDEAKHLADKFILGLAEFFGFAVIKHLSSSVGTQRLSETFGDLFKQKRDSAHQLIDLSIKLDNYQSFPIHETEALAKIVRGNTFAWSLLRRFIWQHFYLHDEDYKLTQRACSLVEIPYERTHYLPPATKREK